MYRGCVGKRMSNGEFSVQMSGDAADGGSTVNGSEAVGLK